MNFLKKIFNKKPIPTTIPMNELLLSKSILDISIKSGNEFGWKISDLPIVLKDAKERSLASVGGQLQYHFDDGTCELYWVSIDVQDRKKDEIWADYVNRTYLETLNSFNLNIKDKDFVSEAVSSFDFVKSKHKDDGIQIKNHEIFILYFETDK